MKGRRVEYDKVKGVKLEPGDYCKVQDSTWWLCTPNGHHGAVCDKKITNNSEHHEIIEHEDGTITVSPSIGLGNPFKFHGYLKRGIWSIANG